jgi:hypothetical protein
MPRRPRRDTLRAMVFYGWLRRPTVLATKNDLCATCLMMGPHAIVRFVNWIEIFFIPILPIWFSHQLICGNCGASRKLSRRQVGDALKSGRMPLPARPEHREYAKWAFQETGRSPQESELDPVEINPARGAWDRYLKLWLLVVPSVIVALVIISIMK